MVPDTTIRHPRHRGARHDLHDLATHDLATRRHAALYPLVPGTSSDVGRYRSSSEVTLYHLDNASHLHNQATTRFRLRDRILTWLPRTQSRS